MQDSDTIFFQTEAGFCPDCGSILPLLEGRGGVKCYACKRDWNADVYGDLAMTEVIPFTKKKTTKPDSTETDTADGPVVERKCPQCQNDKMSYATLQLRSADEGQTVFYTCTKCQFKETENS